MNTHVYEITASNERFNLPGWYFSDECEQEHGPFGSYAEANAAFTHYCETEL